MLTAITRLALIPAAALALACLPHAAVADVVTGTVAPDGAKVVIVDASGATVGQLKSGPYQLQLPVGKYKAKCEGPKAHEQDFLSLSQSLTVNIECGQ